MERWARFNYMPISLLGENGTRITGSPAHVALSRKAASEGMILLKNEDNALPLGKGNCVALFGKASADYVKCGGGSGDVNVAHVTQFMDAMAEKEAEGKLSVFKPLSDFYRDYVAYQSGIKQEVNTNLSAHLVAQFGMDFAPGNMPEPAIPDELMQQAVSCCDTAVISIHRFSTEGGDRGNTPGDGDFYLSAREQKMVDDVKANFDKIIVVLNVSGTVDCSWFADDPKVKGVLLGWQGGMEGASAQADILCGDVCPSGKLTDTLVGNFNDYPSSYNFNESEFYKEYTEDIFVGYRYFETVPGAAQKVMYPFGFGLSYTTFDIATESCITGNGKIEIKLSVTNTGKRAGKEVVQLYVNAPKGYLDTPSLELRAFQKTKLLQPGEKQEITLTLEAASLASYDEKKAAYVLMQGEYKLYLGNSVRNVTCVGSYAVAEDTVTEQLANRCVAKKLTKRLRADGTYEALPVGEYEPRESTDGWPKGPQNYCLEHVLPDMRMVGDPSGDKHHSPDVISLRDVAEGKADMDTFLAQLSDDELLTLISGRPWRNASHTGSIGDIPQYGIPSVPTADGPAGLRFRPNRGITTTCWPVGTLIASTWDPEIAAAIGEAAALEVKENNIGMWLAPALNIHRNPQCGRNFEYYSEDPLLSGKIAAGMVRGIQSCHISACIKHFCCNNTEVNRLQSDSIVSERAMREIYLKGFEITVKEAQPWALMTCYNLVNGKYPSENAELLEGVLRGEWGFDGVITTDWANGGEQYVECKAGNDLRMPSGMHHRMRRALAEGRVTRADMLKSCKNILNFILRMD